MKFTATQINFQKALFPVQRIVSKNFSLPILENALLETERGRLRVFSTNLEIAISTSVPGKVEEQGSLAVNANLLFNIISNLGAEQVTIQTEKNNLTIFSKNYRAMLKGQSAKEFPVVPEIKTKEYQSLKAKEFQEAINQLINIVSISESRPEISGIYMSSSEKEIVLVGTDSFRLGEKRIAVGNGLAKKYSVIVPLRAMQELARLLEGQEKNFEIWFDKNQVMFKTKNGTLISRLIEGSYPDYQQIIPSEFSTEVFIDKEQLLKNIKLVSLFCSRNNDLKMSISAGKKKIILEASSSDIGENKAESGAVIQGEDMEITFNWKFLVDGLNNIPFEKIFLGFNGKDKPALMKGKQDKTYIYIVMPIRE